MCIDGPATSLPGAAPGLSGGSRPPTPWTRRSTRMDDRSGTTAPWWGSCPYRRLNPEPPCKAGGRSVGRRTAAALRRHRLDRRVHGLSRWRERAGRGALPAGRKHPGQCRARPGGHCLAGRHPHMGKGLRLRIPAPHPGARAVVRPRARQPVRGWRIRLRSGPRPAAPGGRASRHDDGPGRAEPQQRADLSSRAGNPAPARCRTLRHIGHDLYADDRRVYLLRHEMDGIHSHPDLRILQDADPARFRIRHVLPHAISATTNSESGSTANRYTA